jgi:hypothetical protein
MSDEIETLMMSLRFEFGWMLGLTAWVTVLRFVFVGFSNKLKEFAEANVAEAGAIQRVLDSLPYRIVAFIINALTSVKLPTVGRKMVDLAKPTGILPLP